MGRKRASIDSEIVGRIHDPIHGFVHLTKAELEVVDSPYFQRLRNIRQLAQANLVFPGGEHTRFAHSLGVLWVMDRICRRLRLPNGRHRTLRMAALLHDIGHFPLSHTLEAVYREEEKKLSQSLRPDLGGTVRTGHASSAGTRHRTPRRTIPKVLRQLQPELFAELHERLGRHIILRSRLSRILKKHGFEPLEIGNIIVGADDYSDLVAKQLMHSDLDADQMDYLIRDAAFLGIGYSAFDLRFLIECLEIRNVSFSVTGLPGRRRQRREVLCVLEKGVHALDHYFLAKHFYYTQILYHKTRHIIEQAAGKVFQEILKAGERRTEAPAYKDLADFALGSDFHAFDDVAFYSLLRKVRKSKVLNKDSETLLQVVLDRKIPSTIYSSEHIVPYEQTSHACQTQERAREDRAKALKRKARDRDPCLKKYGLECIDIEREPLAKFRKELFEEGGNQALAESRDPVRVFDRKRNKVYWAQEGEGSLLAMLTGAKVYIYRAYGKPGGQR